MKRVKAASYKDSYRNLWRALEKYPDAYVHFTNIEKVGVNPKKSHNDPHGVYMYPVRWLRDNFNKMGSQYATSYKWAYILELNDDGRGYVLQDMTEEQVKAIADRNGWREALDLSSDNVPGDLLWRTCDDLQKPPDRRRRLSDELFDKAYPWSKSLAGVSWLEDTGDGIINRSEPCQTLVMDVRLLKVLDKVENKNVGKAEDEKQWRRLMEYYGVKKAGKASTPIGDGFSLRRVPAGGSVGDPDDDDYGWNDPDEVVYTGVVLYRRNAYNRQVPMSLEIKTGDWLAQVQQHVKWAEIVDGVRGMVERKAKDLGLGRPRVQSSVQSDSRVYASFHLLDQDYTVTLTPGKVSLMVVADHGQGRVLKEASSVEEAVDVVEKFVSEHMEKSAAFAASKKKNLAASLNTCIAFLEGLTNA
jgi:hypothetical protein